MSERLELRHVEHLMDVCGVSHDALMLLGTMAVVATVIKQRDAAEHALRVIGKTVDLPGAHSPEKIVEQVKGLRENYARICGRLQDAVQRHKLGLGGEQIDALVVEALDLNAADVRAWQRVYPLIVSHGRALPDEGIRAVARDYYAEVEALAAPREEIGGGPLPGAC